jgi:hypothetical protein
MLLEEILDSLARTPNYGLPAAFLGHRKTAFGPEAALPLGQLEGHGATVVRGIEECGIAVLRIGTRVRVAKSDANRHCIPEGL